VQRDFIVEVWSRNQFHQPRKGSFFVQYLERSFRVLRIGEEKGRGDEQNIGLFFLLYVSFESRSCRRTYL
jgi:hypothetical protein